MFDDVDLCGMCESKMIGGMCKYCDAPIEHMLPSHCVEFTFRDVDCRVITYTYRDNSQDILTFVYAGRDPLVWTREVTIEDLEVLFNAIGK